jgi:hypothetical protein
MASSSARSREIIEGLKLTMTGEEIRKRLAERIKHHRQLVAHDKREATREPGPRDDCDFVLPEHMCEYEQELHGWQATALTYIREHVEGGEISQPSWRSASNGSMADAFRAGR